MSHLSVNIPSGFHTQTPTHFVPVGSHFDFPEVETEQHFPQRPLLAVTGNESVQPESFKGNSHDSAKQQWCAPRH